MLWVRLNNMKKGPPPPPPDVFMCDKFINHGIPRGRISLHAGLNTVMGSSNGSNSIGKSTFLMIIDFAFGGDDYVEK